MRPGIDRIEFNGDFRQFKGRLCLVEIAKDPGMHEMLDVVHLHKAAVERRESRIFPDRVAKDHDRPLPAFLVELRDEILAAQPAVVKIERNVGLACQPHQPLGRQLNVERSRDPADDALLGFEPVAETEPEAFAPDVNPGGIVPQHHHDVDFGARLVGGRFDAVLRRRARGGKHDGRGRAIDHAPFTEADETGGEMLGEPLHQMAVILVDAMHRKGPQHQARPGRCID